MKLAFLHRTDHVRYLQRASKVLPPPEVRLYPDYVVGDVEMAMKERILADLKSCNAYSGFCGIQVLNDDERPGRNQFGECSNAMVNTKTMFCTCCAFREPSHILELLVHYFLRFYEPGYYNGFGTSALFAQSELESLDLRQSLVDFASGNYPWDLVVARHLSRKHFLAVRSEQERILANWTAFITFVNSNRTGIVLKQKAVEYWQARLVPTRPPRPEDGAFLIAREQQEEIKQRIAEEVTRFYTGLELEPDLVETNDFALCDMADAWSIHSRKEPQTDLDRLIWRLIECPEETRRRLNALRNFFEDELDPILSPTSLTFLSFANDAERNAWMPAPEEIQACENFLNFGGLAKTWWVPLTEDTPLQRRKAFVIFEHQLESALCRLLLNYRFEKDCTVDVCWMPKEQEVDTQKALFVLLVQTNAVYFAEQLESIRSIFNAKCTAQGIIINPNPPPPGDIAPGCILIFVRESIDLFM